MNSEQGERGPTGDTGQRGSVGMTGLTGLTGLDGVGLIGERSPTGDHGQHGETGNTGEAGERGLHGDTGQRGPQGFNGLDAPPSSRAANWLLRLAVVLFLAVIILSLAVTLTSQARDQRTIVFLRDQLSARRAEHEAISSDRVNEQAQEDCRNLYEVDIILARMTRDIEEGHLSATIALIPLDTPPGERLEIQQEAVHDLTVKDILLIEAVAASSRYIDADPAPADCPHPDSK